MGSRVRPTLVGALALAVLALTAPAALASFGIERFQALTCKENGAIGAPKECNNETKPEFYLQAGGHPQFAVMDFALLGNGTEGNGVRNARIDMAPGISINAEALPKCPASVFEANNGKAEANHCAESTEAGIQEVEVLSGKALVKMQGTVFNLDPRPGAPFEFGVDLNGGAHTHSLLVGGVSWHKEAEAEGEEWSHLGRQSGDYHSYLELHVAKSVSEGEAPLVRLRLVLSGRAGKGLVRNPTSCAGNPGQQTSFLRVEPYIGAAAQTHFDASASENCAAVPFEPLFSLIPSSTQRDAPDAVTTDMRLHQPEGAGTVAASDLARFGVTFPEGLAVDLARASDLEGCSPAQIAIGSAAPVACPAGSMIGTAQLDVPGLPAGSLTGNIYLGNRDAPEPLNGWKTIYLAVASARYGEDVRLEASVRPGDTSGSIYFSSVPQIPVSDLRMTFDAGVYANPLTCAAAVSKASLWPYSGEALLLGSEFTVDADGQKGACPSPTPFSPTQSTIEEPAKAGASGAFTFELHRPDGQQYVASISARLPAGLLGNIPTVTLCTDAGAVSGLCPDASQIGVVTLEAGAADRSRTFEGRLYMTGPYTTHPYSLVIVVPMQAGSFDLGRIVSRAQIDFDPHTAQMIVTDPAFPTSIAGIPLRMRRLTMTINRQGFLRNPTGCGSLPAETTLQSTATEGAAYGAPVSISSQLVNLGCAELPFKPSLSASTSGRPTRAGGASLVATIKQGGGQSNIRSLTVSLPRQIPSRGSTMQRACAQPVFEAGPPSCPAASRVGTATAYTPTLPAPLTGTAYFVSRAGAPLPDLDLVLEGDSGVRIILAAAIDLKRGITSYTFASEPDMPISSFQLNLPMGPHSALAAYGNLCVHTLLMPTEVTAQNGSRVRQNTKITPAGCGVQIVGHRVIGSADYITVKTFRAGRVTVGGPGLLTTTRWLGHASTAAGLRVPLSASARGRRRPFKLAVHVSFTPAGGGSRSSATVLDTFR